MTIMKIRTVQSGWLVAAIMATTLTAWGAAPVEGYGALTVLVNATDASMQNHVIGTGVNSNGEAYNRISAEYYAASRNQSAAAAMLDSLPVNDRAFQASDAAGAATAVRRSLDRLSASHYANTPTMLRQRDFGFGQSLLRRQALLASRLGFAEPLVIPAAAPTPEYIPAPSPAPAAPPPAPTDFVCDPCQETEHPSVPGYYENALPSLFFPTPMAHNLWAEGTYEGSRLKDDGNGPKSKLHGPGFGLGYEMGTSAGWLGGVAFRYSDLRIKTDDLDSRSDIDAYSFALYGGRVVANRYGVLRASLGAGYSRYEIDGRRRVDIGALGEANRSEYHADAWQVFGEVAQTVYLERGMIEPYLNIGWGGVKSSSFRERGGGATAVAVDTESHVNAQSVLGVRGAMPVNERFAVDGGIGWRHLFGDRAGEMDARLLGGGTSGRILGSKMGRDAMVMNAGVEMYLARSLSLHAGYEGEFGGKWMNHGGTLRVVYGF